ncbi:hypothetical protein EON63_15805 [archaeon]|nr:MAG: hypothetical protein EON63_15805 [archaeon]
MCMCMCMCSYVTLFFFVIFCCDGEFSVSYIALARRQLRTTVYVCGVCVYVNVCECMCMCPSGLARPCYCIWVLTC